MKKLLIMTLLTLVSNCFAQWKPIQNKSATQGEQYYSLDAASLKKQLDKKAASFPNSSGKLEKFAITEQSNFDAELQKKYPNIKSYVGTNGNNTIAIAYSPYGVTTMTLNDSVSTFVEQTTSGVYRQFKKANEPKEFSCGLPYDLSEMQESKLINGGKIQNKAADVGALRTYRKAFACNAEFTAFHGGPLQALAAINITATVENAIFQRDLGIRFVLVSGSENLIYTNAVTDPFTNTATYGTELQNLFDTKITSAKYDFGVGYMKGANQGNAGYIGSVGVEGKKGACYISNNYPVGVIYNVDYNAHEIGHQFGARHTFSYVTEGAEQCEPGSGSTIMGYAGITPMNVQPNSDPYFHAISIKSITAFVQSSTAGTITYTGNVAPTVNAGLDYTVPTECAYELTATGSPNVSTYCWEQIDRAFTANTIPFDNKTVSGVLSRSEMPTTSAARSFPKYGIPTKWDSWSTKPRFINYRCTVRDGKFAMAFDDVKITVVKTPTQFRVASVIPDLKCGAVQVVNWDVAGTTGLGINCAFVKISLIDGNMIETVLLPSVPNNGSAQITIPNLVGKYRIKIKSIGNAFYCVSNEFTVQIASNAVLLSYTVLSPTSIRLNWTQPIGFTQTSFSIYQNPTCDNNDPKGDPCEKYLGTTNGNSFSYTVNNVKAGYTYVVKGKNAAGVRTEKSNTVVVVF